MKQEKKAVVPPVSEMDKLKANLDFHVTAVSKIENLDEVMGRVFLLGFLFLGLFAYKVWNERQQTKALQVMSERVDRVANEVQLVAAEQSGTTLALVEGDNQLDQLLELLTPPKKKAPAKKTGAAKWSRVPFQGEVLHDAVRDEPKPIQR